MPQSGVEHRVENTFARFIEISAQVIVFNKTTGNTSVNGEKTKDRPYRSVFCQFVIPLGLEGADAPSRVYVYNPRTPLKGGIAWVRALANGEKTKDRPHRSVFCRLRGIVVGSLIPLLYAL